MNELVDPSEAEIYAKLRELSELDGFTFDQLRRAYEFFMTKNPEGFEKSKARGFYLDQVRNCLDLIMEDKNGIEN
jgi:hypothetical protein